MTEHRSPTRQWGQTQENLACEYLQQQGLRLVLRNFSCKLGEIDLIMRDKDMLVFVEVRFRKNNNFGGGIASITYHKQKKLIRTAQLYLTQQKLTNHVPCRFDVVSLSADPDGDNIHWIPNAFSEI